MTDTFWGGYSQGLGAINGVGQQLTSRRAGAQIAGGDRRSAATTLLQSGDIGGGLALEGQAQQQQVADQAKQLEFTMQATRALRQAKESGQDVLAAYDSMAPAFQQMGTDPAQIAQMRQALGTDPDQFLQSVEQIVGQQQRELEVVNFGSGRGASVVDLGTGQEVNRLTPDRQPLVIDGVAYDPVSMEVLTDTRKPQYQTVKNADGSETVIAIDQPAPIRGSGGGSTDLGRILDGVIQREGGFVARDGRSGAPANFGINQRANPDIDVANLTEDGARQIYQERYIQPIVEAGVQGPITEAVIDFGVNAGVGRALQFWRQSGGDIDEFNRLRLAHYRSLPDYEQNGRSWERRVAETTPGARGSQVPVGGGARVIAQGQGGSTQLLTEAQKQELGLPLGGVYQRGPDGAIQQVTPPGAGGGRGGGSFDATTRGTLQQADAAARAAQGRVVSANRFLELNRQRGTGVGAGILGPAAELDPVYSEMRAIAAKLIPSEREPGSGPMSDKDIDLYTRGVLSLNRPGPTNSAMVGVINAQARRDTDYAAFLNEYALRNGNLVGATEDWTAYVNANPLFQEGARGNTQVRPNVQSWRAFMGYGERERGGRSGDGQSASRPAANEPRVRFQPSPQQRQWYQQNGRPEARNPVGSRGNPRLINPADPRTSYGNVPSGQYFVTPDGQLRGPKP